MHFHNSTAFSWVPGEAKCLGGEQQAPKSPRLQLHTMGAPSCVPHTVSPRLHDVPLGYTLTLGMSHWADTILDVVPPFTDIYLCSINHGRKKHKCGAKIKGLRHFFPISGICWFLHNLVIVWENVCYKYT